MKIFKKKIGIVVANNRFGGQEKRYFKIAYKLFTDGHNVKLYAHHNLKNQGDADINLLFENTAFLNRISFIKANQPLKKLYKEILRKNLFLNKLNKALKRDKVDLIITNKDLESLKVLDQSDFKIIKDFTSPDDVDLFFQTEDYKNIDKVDHIFFISPSVYNRFNKKLSQCKVCFQLPGFSIFKLPFFNADLNVKLDLSKKEKSIVFAHRFIARKNPLLFAKAIKRLLEDEDLKEWRVYILGRGPLEVEIKKILSDEIELGQVKIMHTPRLKSYLEKSSIFVSLIEPDNFPSQSVLEAMFFGNVLTILDAGESYKFIDGNGILVQKNLEHIVDSIRLLTQKEIHEEAYNSRRIILEKYNCSNYINFYISELDQI